MALSTQYQQIIIKMSSQVHLEAQGFILFVLRGVEDIPKAQSLVSSPSYYALS